MDSTQEIIIPTTEDLKHKYPIMVAFAKYMGSTDWYLETQLWKAYNAQAPENIVAIYVHPFGEKVSYISDYSESQQQGIKHYLV